MNDITAFADFDDKWRSDNRTQLAYKIKDGELPHMISHRLYGTVDYWWTILKINRIYDLTNQWPRREDELVEYINNKYPGKLLTDVHHYVDRNGLVYDLITARITTGLTNTTSAIDKLGLTKITIEDFEYAINDDKRNIILIDPDYIGAVQLEFDKAMQPAIES